MKNNTIPKRFIRIWLGSKNIPDKFEEWWRGFQDMHPDYAFMTLTDRDLVVKIPDSLLKIYYGARSYAGRSDVLRMIALHEYGGVYVDTDVMPLKSFDGIIDSAQPFAGRRSGKSFEIAVLGSPKGHPATKALIDGLPDWYEAHKDRSCSVATGPAFFSSVWFGRKDVTHLPPETFYPYNGFMAPKREEKNRLFSDPNNFPPEMLAAHYSGHQWGGTPR